MEGPAPAARGERFRRTILPIIAIVVGIALIAAIVVFSAPGLLPAPNTPPYGLSISASPPHPDNATVVTFTASVSDHEDPSSAIQVRWAWQGSGTWDTSWTSTKTATHLFHTPGNYTIVLEAMDTGGLTASTSANLAVTRHQPPVLRIGTILSITGALAAFGQGQQNGVDMAVAEINAAGGVLGQPIQVFHMDDQTNPMTAANVANTLITTDHVDAIIGSTGSGQCATIVPIAAANSVMEVAPSCTSPKFSNLTFTQGWFARTVPSDALQAVVAASYAYTNLSLRYAGVIGINNVYGTATAAAFAQSFIAKGGTITMNSPRIVAETTGTPVPDYTNDLVAVLGVTPQPQVVYVIGYPPDGVQLMKNFDTLLGTHPSWSSVRWMFSEGLYDPSFINPLVSAGVNVSAFEGTSPAAYAGLEYGNYDSWAARYTNLYGSSPPLFAANAYDAAYLIALAAQAGGSASGATIRAHLAAVANPPGTVVGPNGWSTALASLGAGQDVNYEGASGSVNVNATGDVPSAYIIWAVSNTNQFYTFQVFPESLVVALAPAGAFAQALSASPTGAAWSDSAKE